MTLRRTMDAMVLNRAANDPTVRPWLGGEGPIDLKPVLSDPHNVALTNGTGGFVGIRHEPGVYECHSIFPEAERGPATIKAMQDGLRYLFVETDCLEVITKVPVNNRAALGLSKMAGFSTLFTREKVWKSPEGEMCDVAHMSLPVAKWMQREPLAETWGKWFHERLEQLSIEAGNPIPEHAIDVSHNRAVGAAVMMLQAQNPMKAVCLYNRWARFAGYPVIALQSITPPIIDMNEAVVGVRDGDMEILLCR